MAIGKINLCGIAGDDELGIAPHPREEHLHLRHGGVLRFVQDHEGVVQRAAAHKGQRRDLDHPFIQMVGELGSRDHLAQRVVERLQVRIQFLAEVAGQETEILPRFHRRSGEHDAAHLPLLQRFHGEGHGGVGLSGPRGADGEHHVAAFNGFHQPLLVPGACFHPQTRVAVHEHVGLIGVLAFAGAGVGAHDVVQHLAWQFVVAGGVFHQLRETCLELGDLIIRPAHLQRVATSNDAELGEERADEPQVGVVGAQDLHRVHTGDGDQLLDQSNFRLLISSARSR